MLIFRRSMLVVVLGLNVFTVNAITRRPQSAQAQSGNGSEDALTMTVGVVGNPPFTIFGANPQAEITGISLDGWQGGRFSKLLNFLLRR